MDFKEANEKQYHANVSEIEDIRNKQGVLLKAEEFDHVAFNRLEEKLTRSLFEFYASVDSMISYGFIEFVEDIDND